MYFFEPRRNFRCPQSIYPQIVSQLPNGNIQLNFGNDSDYNCFYRSIAGTLQPNAYRVDFKSSWQHLSNKTDVNSDQFVVKCMNLNSNSTVFMDAFVKITEKTHIRQTKFSDDKLNIILLVLDSVSYGQFQRHMPKTLDFLKERDAAIMKGYYGVSFYKVEK